MLGSELVTVYGMSAAAVRDAARRFGVEGHSRMTKPELVEALEYTAWRVEAEVPHTAIRSTGSLKAAARCASGCSIVTPGRSQAGSGGRNNGPSRWASTDER